MGQWSMRGAPNVIIALFWMLVTLASCSTEEAPAVAGLGVPLAAAPLAADLSEPVDVLSWRNYGYVPPSSASSSAMACGTDGCLLLYTREIAFADPQTFLYGTRIGDDGALLDEPRLFFGEATSIVSIVARDDDYLALWTVAGDGGDEARVGRFDVDTGQLVEDLTFVLPAGINHSFHLGQSTLLILYENTGSWYTQLLDLGALEPVGDARALASKPAAIASGGGMYLLAWSEVAERISETTGASLDLQPIVYTGYWPGTPRAVFVDGTFQLAWENQNDLYGSRIQASDGTVLDADTDTASGSKLLCSDCLADYLCGAVRKANLSLSLLGSDVVVSWPGVTSSNGCISSTALYGVRVDPATGEAMNSFNRPTVSVRGTVAHSLHVTPQGQILKLDRSYVHTLNVTSVMGYTLEPDLAQPYSVELMRPTRLALTAGSSGYLAAWARPEIGTESYATRLPEQAGPPLDEQAFHVGAGGTFAVASDGSDYLVVWRSAAAISRRFIRGNGTMAAALPTPLPESTSASFLVRDFSLAYGASGFLLAWIETVSSQTSGRFLRLTTTGNTNDTTPGQTYSSNCGSCTGSAVWAVVNPNAEATPGSYLLLSALGTSARFSTIDVSGAATTAGEAFDVEPPAHFAVAQDGVAVITRDNDNAQTMGWVFDPDTLQPRADDPMPLGLCTDCIVRSFWFDGFSYLAAVEDTATGRLFLRSFTAELSPDPSSPGELNITDSFATGPYEERLAAGASGAPGQSVVLYPENDAARSGVVIRARWLSRSAEGWGGELDGGTSGTDTSSAAMDSADSGETHESETSSATTGADGTDETHGSDTSQTAPEPGGSSDGTSPGGGTDAGAETSTIASGSNESSGGDAVDGESDSPGASDSNTTAGATGASVESSADDNASDAGVDGASTASGANGDASDGSAPQDVSASSSADTAAGGCACTLVGAAQKQRPHRLGALAVALALAARRRRRS